MDLLLPDTKKEEPTRRRSLPNIYFCGSCKRIYYSINEIYKHSRFGHTGGKKVLKEEDEKSQKQEYEIAAALRKGEIDTELRKDCTLQEFLEWFLAIVLVDRKSKCIDNEHFIRLCTDKLLGAPMDCDFDDFMLWVLNEAWDIDENSQREFVRKLFDPPRHEINWHLYKVSNPLANKGCPFICVWEGPFI